MLGCLVAGQQQVLELDVTMDHAVLVCVGNSRSQLREEISRQCFRKRTLLLQEHQQISSVGQFGDVACEATERRALEQAQHIGMLM